MYLIKISYFISNLFSIFLFDIFLTFFGGILLGIEESIDFLKKGTRHYNLIVVNQNSVECVKECKSLDFPNIKKINMDEVLLDILADKTDDQKLFESWDFTRHYLASINSDLLIIYNIDYMFSPDLGNQDIIKNFKYFSRTRKILLFVKGEIIDNDLIHSEEGFDDFKRMDISEVIIEGW